MKLLLFLLIAPFLLSAADLVTKDGQTFKNFSPIGFSLAGLHIMQDNNTRNVHLIAWRNLTEEQKKPYIKTLRLLKKRQNELAKPKQPRETFDQEKERFDQVTYGRSNDYPFPYAKIMEVHPFGAVCFLSKTKKKVLVVDIPEESLLENTILTENELCHHLYEKPGTDSCWACGDFQYPRKTPPKKSFRLYKLSDYIYINSRGARVAIPRYTYSRKKAFKIYSFPRVIKLLGKDISEE